MSGPLKWDEAALALRQEREKQKLRRMVSYGYHGGCRMRFFLDYFGDHFRDAQHGTAGPGAERTRCGFCDNCLKFTGAPLSAEDQLVVRKALACVARMDGRFGRRRVAEVLKGHASEEVQRAGLDQLTTFGILSDRSLPWLADLLTTLEAGGLVGNSGGEYPTVRLLPAGREVMHDRQKALLALPAEAPVAAAGRKKREPRIQKKLRSSGAERLAHDEGPDDDDHPLSPPQPAAQARSRAALAKPTPPKAGRGASADATDDDLPLTAEQEARFERLRLIRSELARDAKVAPFIVFHDRTLRALARTCPQNRAALGRVPGIGDNKLQRYGDKVLKALREADR